MVHSFIKVSPEYVEEYIHVNKYNCTTTLSIVIRGWPEMFNSL